MVSKMTVPFPACSWQQRKRVPLAHNLTNTWFGASLKYFSVLEVIQWYFIVVSICVSLLTNDGEHFPCGYGPFFFFFWALFIFSLMPSQLKSLYIFLYSVVFLLIIDSWEFFIYYGCQPFVRHLYHAYFLPVCALPLHSPTGAF